MQGLQGSWWKVLREEGLHPASYRKLDAIQNVGARIPSVDYERLHRHRHKETLPQGVELETNAEGHRTLQANCGNILDGLHEPLVI